MGSHIPVLSLKVASRGAHALGSCQKHPILGLSDPPVLDWHLLKLLLLRPMDNMLEVQSSEVDLQGHFDAKRSEISLSCSAIQIHKHTPRITQAANLKAIELI